MKSYIIDETWQAIRENKPFAENLISLKSPYDWNELLDIILTQSQQLAFYGSRITFAISDKKINKAIERFGKAKF